jgi:hypothetical protein
MESYDVVVRNELTEEVATVALRSSCPQEAQVEALVQLFRLRGWRKAVAFPAERGPGQASAE